MPNATYGPKVYRAQGGDELVVANGGKITVEAGGELNLGGSAFTQAAAQADSEATEVAGVVSDFNDLLGKLRTAGIIADE